MRNHIVAAKKIYVSDVAFIVPRFNWVSGSSYAKYNTLMTGDITSSGPKFYVYDDINYRVYKCINNNNSSASTVRPTSTEAFDVTYSDGYTWRYMYSIPKSLRNKFVTDSYIPVFTALQKRYYSDGGIGDITIIKAGSGYTQATAVITVSGDGSGAVLTPVIVNGQLGDIIVNNPGRDYTRAVLSITDSGSGAGAEAVAELNTGDLDSDQALVELLTVGGTVDSAEVLTGGSGYVTASVQVIGDGTGAMAEAVIVGTTISRIVITSKGKGYSFASLVITPQNIPAITSAATTRVNISSFLGHGRNAVDELFADQLMFYSNITSDRLADFDVVTPYKQFGIMKNLRNLEYTSNIYDQVSPNRYQVEADFGPQVIFVGGGGTGAKGRVNVTGNFVSDVQIESSGAGYISTPTVSFGKQLTTLSVSRTSNVSTATFAAQFVAPYPVGSSVIVTGTTVSSGVGFNGTFTVKDCTTTSVSWVDNNSNNTANGQGTVITSGSGATAVTTIDAKLNTATLSYGGVGYVSPPGVTVSSTTGSGGAITATNSLGVGAVNITNQGSAYAIAPSVGFTGGSGSVEAIATAVIANGKVVKIIITNPGKYTVVPTGVTFSSGVAAGTVVQTYTTNSLTIDKTGSGYQQNPTLTFNGSCGISDITVDDPGYLFTSGSNPALTFDGGGGNGLAATAYVNDCVRSVTITNSGTGYYQAGALIPTTTFTTITGVKPTGTVTSTTVTTKSSSGSGTGATFSITTTGSGATYTGVTTITLVSAGSGYAVGNTVTISGSALGGLDSVNDLTFTLANAVGALPVVTFGGAGGATATGTAVVSGGKVVGINITNRGTGYTSGSVSLATTAWAANASVTLNQELFVSDSNSNRRYVVSVAGTTSSSTAPTHIIGSASNGTATLVFVGILATATVTVGLGISHVNITNPGTGYTGLPTITVANNGTRAGYVLTPVLGKAAGSTTVIGSLKTITLTSNGNGYTSAPTVNLTGGLSGNTTDITAVAYSKVVGSVTSITVDDGGSGYSSRPSVIIYGGEGIGASYVADIDTSTGKVKQNPIKVTGGSNYVTTKFTDFTIGTLLVDEQLNEYNVFSAKTNLENNSLIITSNNGYPVVGKMKIRKKNAANYFITNTAISQKFLESRFPVACYKVRGSFTLANYPANTTVTLSDQVNGTKTFIVISSKFYDIGVNEMLLLPIDGGTLNNGMTLTNGSTPFSVLSYDEPALDRRTGEVLMIANNSSSFTQNADQTLSFRTIINF